MASFTPEGLLTPFLDVFAPYVPPPPPGTPPPTLWGSEEHVRRLFGGRLDPLELTRREYVERSPTPEAYWAFYRETFGPVVALTRALADRPEQAAAFERDFLDFATRANRGAPGGEAEYAFEYLLVVGRRPG
jgi:2-polyprenyl-6-hydroxyphenyl methylase/3-demethylubiquinone-9 3-methyltransferase